MCFFKMNDVFHVIVHLISCNGSRGMETFIQIESIMHENIFEMNRGFLLCVYAFVNAIQKSVA